MIFLTPLAALVATAVLAPAAAVLLGRARVRAARRQLALEAPSRRGAAGRLGCGVGAIALLGLAAAQPALTDTTGIRERTDAAALFVLDISRSMAASATPSSPTRLARAVNTAVEMRAAIPGVPAGIATLTDRVLPSLLPVADLGTFDGVARRAVAIENPPPSQISVVATTFAALPQIVSGDYFGRKVTRRIVVLLTDGESNPVDPARIAGALDPYHGYRFIVVRFWNANERVYGGGGRAQPGYVANPIGSSIVGGLAAALQGRSFTEGETGAAASYLRALAGTGPTVAEGTVPTERPLAPFLAGLAALLLLVAVLPPAAIRRVRSGWWSSGTTSRTITPRNRP